MEEKEGGGHRKRRWSLRPEDTKEDTLEKPEDNLDRESDEEDESGSGADNTMIAVTVMGFAIAALVLIIVVLLISGALSGHRGSSSISQSTAEAASGPSAEQTTVPDITGKTESDAQEILSDRHLGMKFSGEQTSNQDEGVILSQNPKAGAKVSRNSTVTYVRSSGPERVAIPDVTGDYLVDAKVELMNLGFESIEVEQKHSKESLGTVIATSPASDRKVTTTEKIVLTVSIGQKSKTAFTGDYRNLTASNAAREAADDGIICDLTYGESDFAEVGSVMSQDIEPGSQVASGTLITLTVNEKKPDSGELEGTSGIREADSTDSFGGLEQSEGKTESVTLVGPKNYAGGAATFVLVQEKDGKEYQIVEQTMDQVSFPVQISLKKVIGVSSGTLWLYEQAGDDMTRRASWSIS